MTKAELLATVEENVKWASSEITEVTESMRADMIADGTVKIYERVVVSKSSDTVGSTGVQPFCVINEGEDNEEAFFLSTEKADKVTDPFAGEVKAYLSGFIGATILKINVESVDSDDEFAIITAYQVDADNQVYGQKYFVYRYDGGDFSYKKYVG